MKTLGFEQVKMSQNVLAELYKLAKGDKSSLSNRKSETKSIKAAYERLEEIENMLKSALDITDDKKQLDDLMAKNKMFKDELDEIASGYSIDFKKNHSIEYDKLQTWTNALRFASLFFNDGKVNLITKDSLKDAVDGKFPIITTNKGDTINEMIEHNFPGTGLGVSKLKDIGTVLRNNECGKKSDKKKMEVAETFMKYNDDTGKYESLLPNVRFELGKDHELRCVFPHDMGVDVVITINNVDRKEALREGNLQDVLANKYSINYETKPLKYVKVIKPATHKFVDGKKVSVPPVYANIDSDELFNLFRNANAHASRQVYNPKTNTFSYHDENSKSTVMYDFGWLQGFSSFFLNEGQCMLYGENSEYDGLPGWKKDWTRKKFLNPNNEFPIIINKLPEDDFRKFEDFKKFLNDRKYVLVTLNDNVKMIKAEQAIEQIRADFYSGRKELKKYAIESWLKKYKFKNWEVKEVEPKNKDKMLKYWENRLASIPGFYKMDLFSQLKVISEIEMTNKFNLDDLTSNPNIKFNYSIMAKFMEMINLSVQELNKDGNAIAGKFELSKKTVKDLQILNQEYSVLFATMMVYTSLIQSGFADIVCDYDGENKKYNMINIADQKAIEKLNLDKFKLLRAKGNACIEIESKDFGVDDKKDVLRIVRHAVAHGRVAVKDIQEYYNNPDDIKLVFHAHPATRDKSVHNMVETTVGAIMETFKDPMFRTPTNTVIKGTQLTKF